MAILKLMISQSLLIWLCWLTVLTALTALVWLTGHCVDWVCVRMEEERNMISKDEGERVDMRMSQDKITLGRREEGAKPRDMQGSATVAF